MRQLGLAVVLVVACSKGDTRDADCAKVRAAIDKTPRRYQDEALANLSFSDPALNKAAHDRDVSAVKSLCKIVSANARQEDCARLRMVVQTTREEKENVGLFDPELAKPKYYEDPQIKALVQQLEDSGWSAFAPAGSAPDARVAQLRAICGIE